MRRFSGIHFLIACGILLLLCPSKVWAQQDAGALLGEACGPDQAKFEVRQDNAWPSSLDERASKGRVIIFVESLGILSGCGPVRIGIDGRWLGAACLNTGFSTDVDPGTHHLCVDFHWRPAESRVGLQRLTIEAGKTYYFRAEVIDSYGLNAAIHLDPLDADEGELLVNTQKLSRSKTK